MFWNYVDVLSSLFALAFLILNLLGLDANQTRAISGVTVLLLWTKMFYFLRIFDWSASLMRVIIETFKDMFVFMLIFFLAVLGFAHSFFILSLGVPIENRITGPNIGTAIIYSYRTGQGDFDTDNFSHS